MMSVSSLFLSDIVTDMSKLLDLFNATDYRLSFLKETHIFLTSRSTLILWTSLTISERQKLELASLNSMKSGSDRHHFNSSQ
jgi:hypothetical protein